MRIDVVYAPAPGQIDSVTLELAPGATLQQALRASGLLERHGLGDAARAGIWGRVHPPDAVLRERDRVEVYRPLQVDPKEARRLRYRQRAAGRSSG